MEEAKVKETTHHTTRLGIQKAAVAHLGKYLEGKGYVRGIFGPAPHHHGLPKIANILIRPTYSEQSGSAAVMVGLTEVFLCAIAQPYPTSEWQVVRRNRYKTTKQLDELLVNLCYEDLGIWGEEGVVKALRMEGQL